MRSSPRLALIVVFTVTALFPNRLKSQTAALNQDQLEQRIAALQPFACDSNGDTRTQSMRTTLADYQRQLKDLLTASLKDPARQKLIDALSQADKDILTQAWNARIAKLDTPCPADVAARNTPTPPVLPVPAAAKPLADKVMGNTTYVLPTPSQPSSPAGNSAPPASGQTPPNSAAQANGATAPSTPTAPLLDVHQAVIRAMAEKRSESFGDLAADHMELIFGPTDVATQSDPQTVTITNKSGGDLYLISAEVPERNYTLVENLCGNKLPNDAHCSLKVAFSPFDTVQDNLLSSLLIRFTNQKDGMNPRDFPITLRGSAIHWKFPFTRAVAGLDISATSSKPTKFAYFIEFNLTAPTDRFFKRSKQVDPLESRTWVFLNPRITSVPTNASAIDNLNPSLDSFNSLVTTNLTKIGQGVDANLGLEVALLKPRDGIAWWSDFPNSHAKLAISLLFAGGAITPFSSDKTQQSAALNQSILDAFPGQVSTLLDPATCLDATKAKLQAGCATKFITFLTPERSRFFRKYYAGLRFKTFFFNENVPGECTQKWIDDHKNTTCSAPYNIFPGTLDLAVGQDESVTGGVPRGLVWRLDAVYPLHFLPSLHVFGSLYGTFQKNQNSRPFQLVQPSNTDTLTDANTLRFLVPIQNRDYYRIGLGIDLIQLFKKNDAGQPDTALTPKDTSKNSPAPQPAAPADTKNSKTDKPPK